MGRNDHGRSGSARAERDRPFRIAVHGPLCRRLADRVERHGSFQWNRTGRLFCRCWRPPCRHSGGGPTEVGRGTREVSPSRAPILLCSCFPEAWGHSGQQSSPEPYCLDRIRCQITISLTIDGPRAPVVPQAHHNRVRPAGQHRLCRRPRFQTRTAIGAVLGAVRSGTRLVAQRTEYNGGHDDAGDHNCAERRARTRVVHAASVISHEIHALRTPGHA